MATVLYVWILQGLVCDQLNCLPILFSSICEIAHTVAINYQVYRTTIVYYGKIEMLTRSTAVGPIALFGGLITLLVQVRKLNISLCTPLTPKFSTDFLCITSHKNPPAAIQQNWCCVYCHLDCSIRRSRVPHFHCCGFDNRGRVSP